MIWPFKKKTIEEKKKEYMIEFRSDDPLRIRAENIWKALGFINDRNDSILKLTEYLSMYRQWDIENERNRVKNIDN